MHNKEIESNILHHIFPCLESPFLNIPGILSWGCLNNCHQINTRWPKPYFVKCIGIKKAGYLSRLILKLLVLLFFQYQFKVFNRFIGGIYLDFFSSLHNIPFFFNFHGIGPGFQSHNHVTTINIGKSRSI